ncbi:MAG: DEAD/DEAH box helicase [bacterium]|nr:DEAD/DEAH box helicase [bacterium]
MFDVIGSARLKRVYEMYLQSAFPFSSPSLEKERSHLLSGRRSLARPMLIEPTPVYESSGLTLEQACSNLSGAAIDLIHLAKPIFGDDLTLYTHQWESLDEVVNQGKNIVVTTGTGSGKTECFLLPLLASIAARAANGRRRLKELSRPGGLKARGLGASVGVIQAGLRLASMQSEDWSCIP